jgi:hypothetical protein
MSSGCASASIAVSRTFIFAQAGKLCLLPIAQEQWEYQLPRATPYQLPNNTNRYHDYLVMVRMANWVRPQSCKI